jgi:hypothetical protein
MVHCIVEAQGLSYRKEAIVRGNARPSPSRHPSLNISLSCVIASPGTEMNGLNLKRTPIVVHETKSQTPAP